MKDLKITSSTKELTEQLMNENNTDDIKDIINIFNVNLQKKNVIRANVLSDLQDKITNQIHERLDKHADEFSNKDLITYFKVMQETIDNSNQNVVELPIVQINNQINIDDSSTLSRESKDRVADAIKSILMSNQPLSEDEVITVEEDNIIEVFEDENSREISNTI